MSTPADALVDRLFTAALGTFDLAGVYLGDRLGWYRSLSEDGPATPEELAERTRTDARYAREWLEQQAVGGILEVDGEHRFSLTEAHASVLVDPESLSLMAPLARMTAAAVGQLPRLVEAYRSGAGNPWAAYGADMREGGRASTVPRSLICSDASGCRRSATSTSALSPIPPRGWPTSGAARAGRRWPWRVPIRWPE